MVLYFSSLYHDTSSFLNAMNIQQKHMKTNFTESFDKDTLKVLGSHVGIERASFTAS